jgi:hypothetical protein
MLKGGEKTMRKLIMAGLVLTVTILFSACEANPDSGQKQDGTAASASNTTVDTSVTTGASSLSETIGAAEASEAPDTTSGKTKVVITPPDGWESFESAGILVSYQKGTATFSLKEEPYFRSETLNEVVEEAKDVFNNCFEGLEYRETENISIDVTDAVKLPFTCEVSQMKMKYEIVYFFVDNVVYGITMGDLKDSFEGNAAEFGKILNSIKLK